MAVIDNLPFSKSKRIKGTSQDWFDAEIMEKISERNKIIKKFKKFPLHVNKDNCKEARNEVQKLIHTSKLTENIESKLTGNMGKPK